MCNVVWAHVDGSLRTNRTRFGWTSIADKLLVLLDDVKDRREEDCWSERLYGLVDVDDDAPY